MRQPEPTGMSGYRSLNTRGEETETNSIFSGGNAYSPGGIRNSIGHFGYEMVARQYCIVFYCIVWFVGYIKNS